MIPLALICALLVAALLYRERQHSLHTAERERTWDVERGALLTRIQHPEIVIPTEKELPPDSELIQAEDDEIGLVGTVVHGD